MAGRAVRRLLAELGYTVHTPSTVFGGARLAEGIDDEEWLAVAGENGWVVIGRDQMILDREMELAAYLRAQVHMFLLPGSATRAQILELLAANLASVCASAPAKKPGVYWITTAGVVDLDRRRARRRGRQRRRP